MRYLRVLSALAIASGLAAGVGCKTQARRDGEVRSTNQLEKTEALRRTVERLSLTNDCPSDKVCFTVIQMNDVYEIGGRGESGGLDRVAALRSVLAENATAGPVLTVLAGDFFNPSGLGTIKENGKPWAGRPMISVLKAAQTDFVILGNHEFDLKQPDFQARLDESVSPVSAGGDSCQTPGSARGLNLLGPSNLTLPDLRDALEWARLEANEEIHAPGFDPKGFVPGGISCPNCTKAGTLSLVEGSQQECGPVVYEGGPRVYSCLQWIASNVFAGPVSDPSSAQPLRAGTQALPAARLITVKNGSRTANIGLLGLTVLNNKKDYIQFANLLPTAKNLVTQLMDGNLGAMADAVVAITHLNRQEDLELLDTVPEIDFVMGGHDHKSSLDCANGPRRCVAKADANARTVYLHRFIVDAQTPTKADRLTVQSHLLAITDELPSDPKVKAVVDCWFKRAEAAMQANAAKGPKLHDIVAHVQGNPLDGTEEGVRHRRGTNLTQLYAKSMLQHANASGGTQRFSFAFFNAGVVRIDDLVGPGPIEYYELIRVLPFGGNLFAAKVRLGNFAKVLRRVWQDLPSGHGAILHVYPRLAAVDEDPAAITEERILGDLMQSAAAQSQDEMIHVIANDYLLKFGDDMTAAEKAYFEVSAEPFPNSDMRELLVTAMKTP